MRLYQVRVLTDDFPRSFAFYSQTLQLPVVWGDTGGPYAGFGAEGEAGVAVFERDGMSQAAEVLAGKPTAQERCNSPMIVLQVESVDQSYAALSEQGVNFETAPRDYPGWTIRAAHLRDPDGTLIELFEPLPSERWTDEARADNARSLQRRSTTD